MDINEKGEAYQYVLMRIKVFKVYYFIAKAREYAAPI